MNEKKPLVKVRYHKELCPELLPMEQHGNFIDLRAAENVSLKKGEFALISLGVSMELPKGYWAQLVSRSSTFNNFGIIETNGFGAIDTSYCGDNDIWRVPALAFRDTEIKVNDRIAQFRIVQDIPFDIETVEKLGNEDRGGFGSTGTN